MYLLALFLLLVPGLALAQSSQECIASIQNSLTVCQSKSKPPCLSAIQNSLSVCQAPAPPPPPPPPPPPAGAAITTLPTTAAPGASLTVSVSGGPGNARDWVGLYAVGAADTAFLAWKYLDGSQTPPATGVTQATLTFSAPQAAGSYEFRLFADNGYTRLAKGPTVVVSGSSSSVLPRGDCSKEGGLAGRSDIVFCESWERSDWWTVGYVRDGSKTNPQPATVDQVSQTSIVTTGCISGSCLKVNMPQGLTNSLGILWPFSNAGLSPQQLYLRYYIRLGPTWDPYQSDGTNGGKFPGVADVRTTADPSGQCGNGGDSSDGINCWSMRAVFANCLYTLNGSHNACADAGKPTATMRYGSYLYFPGQASATGSNGLWDSFPNLSPNTGSNCQTPSDVGCGLGVGGMFLNDRWYQVEMFVKMNTPGQSDGIIRGWVDGVLSYEKTNMVFRLVGHDNLHVRNIWLNVYKGGVVGNATTSEIYLDQLVAATDAPIGAWTTGQADLADNEWRQVTPQPSQRYIPANYMASDVLENVSLPRGRAYGGIQYGNGKLYYFGGGHGGYPGNDVEVYDIAANRWTQSYKPEVCDLNDGSCNGIYGGWGVTTLTPQGRPYTEHTFEKYKWDGSRNALVANLSGGMFTFDPATVRWTRLGPALIGQSDILTWNLLSYDPDVSGNLAILADTSASPSPGWSAGVYKFLNGAWSRVGDLPLSGGTNIYSTYLPDRHQHFVWFHRYVNRYYLLDARTMTWTPVPNPPEWVDSFDYDTRNKVIIGVQHFVPGTIKLFVYDPATNAWTSLSTTAPFPSQQPDGASAFAPLLRYDPLSNVFIFLSAGGGSGGTGGWTETWAYRYRR